MFTGEYRVAVDDKGRIAVPVRFRAEFAAGGLVSKWLDGCIALHPRAAWEAIAARVDPLPFTDARGRELQRFLYGTAFEIELDKQGRLVVPAVLRTFAKLGDQAVMVGSRTHLELWSPTAWETWSDRMDQPDVLAEHLQGLGI
ncbi:MAG: division/cell wall cluster transcriptional repressor MraZ [Chloroflexi bacterium]|nr:division/cell wall cluster transcriptional repressor MraZ [Chloroflexota bacterium]